VIDEKSGKTCGALFSGKNPANLEKHLCHPACHPAEFSEMEGKNVEKVARKKKLDTFLASPSNPCTTQTLSEC